MDPCRILPVLTWFTVFFFFGASCLLDARAIGSESTPVSISTIITQAFFYGYHLGGRVLFIREFNRRGGHIRDSGEILQAGGKIYILTHIWLSPQLVA